MAIAWVVGLVLLLNPLDLTDSLQLELDGSTVAIVSRADYALPFEGVPLVDDEKLDNLVKQLEGRVYRAPINATINEQGQIVPEIKGIQLNPILFKLQFYSYFYSSGPTHVNDTYQYIYPKVDKGLLEHVRQKKIGQYSTFFNPNNKNRSHNISLATKAINNFVVLPGEIFSFNKVVGKRTKEKGYQQAPIIVKGELSEGIGGGICQVSSTLYNAVDRAGLHIVKRYSHSRHVPYVPPGRDATVSWYGPDFLFQNKYAYPVLIQAKSIQGRMIVQVHSFPEIEYEPRNVPSAQNHLPEETVLEQNVGSP